MDMRGWRNIGLCNDLNWVACWVWAKSNQRRLIRVGGPVVLEYEVQEAKRDAWVESFERQRKISEGGKQ